MLIQVINVTRFNINDNMKLKMCTNFEYTEV